MNKEHKPVTWSLISWIFSQIRAKETNLQIRSLFVIGMILITICLQFSLSFTLKYIVNMLELNLKGITTPNIVILCFGYGFLWIFTRFITEIREIFSYRVLANSVKQITCNFFDHLIKQPMSFHANRNFGAITDELKRTQYTLYKGSLGFFLTILPQTIEALIALVIIWRIYSLDVSLICTSFLIALAYVSIKSGGVAVTTEQAANQAENEQSNFLFDHLLNIEAIQSFTREQHEQKQFETILYKTETARISAQKQQTFMMILHGALTGSLLLCITLITGYRVLTGSYTIGDFIFMNSYIVQFSESISQLGKHIRNLRESLVDLQGMYELFENTTETLNSDSATDLDTSDTSIAFKNITFSYFPDRPLLTNISFEIPMGSTLALVGSSGSGKSTIAKLLLRLYEPSLGTIIIGGKRISDITVESLRNAIGYVPQNPVLFNETILYNIAYGNPKAPFDDVTRAAEQAKIHDLIISLPNKYDTRIGELGLTLSGGERQRIALARALIKNPAFFVFDEGTSALDTHTEQAFMKNLQELSEGRTTLIIAHRLSTIVNADKIIVLEHGRIKEQGTHQELLELNKIYAQLWYRQQEVSE